LSGGTLTLTGTASDTWIFKSDSDLIISGGAPARVSSPSCNVWWRVVSTATFDSGSSLVGNILADTSITMAAGASLAGKALARTAEVTLSSNTVADCAIAGGGGGGAGVPTLPEWAMITLSLLLALAGAFAMRSRGSRTGPHSSL
jgi:hypothetical protein